jgi:hypothetical protein
VSAPRPGEESPWAYPNFWFLMLPWVRIINSLNLSVSDWNRISRRLSNDPKLRQKVRGVGLPPFHTKMIGSELFRVLGPSCDPLPISHVSASRSQVIQQAQLYRLETKINDRLFPALPDDDKPG